MPSIETPDRIYAELFDAVQGQRVFDDSNTFVDAVPKQDPSKILAAFRARRDDPEFDLARFVAERFEPPQPTEEPAQARRAQTVRERINSLWDILLRPADADDPHSSLIPLPRSYIVPGGRFREIYYWDSYFTMLGLAASGRADVIGDMVDNFAWLIRRVGFIPNGNRTYYCTRSQPPVFALMVKLLAEVRGDPAIPAQYLDALEAEYRFWMAGPRVVAAEGGLLNHYWDDSDRPRQESYAEDMRLAEAAGAGSGQLLRDIRAACESGWDFSSRWLSAPGTLASIRTTRILPVDLNALMCHLESTLAEICEGAGRHDDAAHYRARADERKRLLRSLFFDEDAGMFVDLLLPDFRPSGVLSLASAYPLFFGQASAAQAGRVCERIEGEFLRPGGWVTTPIHSEQQWDAPNGWAPLQWIVYQGLRNYGFEREADEGARRWVRNNIEVYERSGRLLEKYNVEQIGAFAGGGEYEVQHGFGWTNGVLLSLMDRLDMP